VTLIGPQFPEVLGAAQEGAEWAWSRLYHSLAAQLAGYARAKQAPDPEEVVGEVFHDMARNITKFSGNEAGFRSWAFGIAHNRLIDQWRKQQRRRRHGRPAIGETASAEQTALTAVWDGPAFQALAQLTAGQREVMVLRTIADMSLEQVAEILETNVNSVKALQHRAVTRLKRTLEEPVTK
jgi:RNA polymerase sigma-70 factor (ECF subfamily)